MKKTLMIALAGMMLFAFTQCGGDNKGSKEFQDNKALTEKFEKAINEAQTCDELQNALLEVLISGMAMEEYAEEDKMTEAEQAELEKLSEKLEKVMEAKVAELGCEDEEEIEEEINEGLDGLDEEINQAIEEINQAIEELE